MAEHNEKTRPYTVAEAADLADVNIKTAYEAVRTGQWPSIRAGKVIRIPRPAFDRLIETGKVA